MNGEKITDIRTNKNGIRIVEYTIPSDYGSDDFYEKDIKTIVTKEQFKYMEYRIGGWNVKKIHKQVNRKILQK